MITPYLQAIVDTHLTLVPFLERCFGSFLDS